MIETRIDPPKPMVSFVMDGVERSVPEGSTILEACRDADIAIPTLCYLETLEPFNSCRACVVEVAGSPDVGSRLFSRGHRRSRCTDRI